MEEHIVEGTQDAVNEKLYSASVVVNYLYVPKYLLTATITERTICLAEALLKIGRSGDRRICIRAYRLESESL
jgi:hypothetical protein